jgi:hypothetical protein
MKGDFSWRTVTSRIVSHGCTSGIVSQQGRPALETRRPRSHESAVGHVTIGTNPNVIRCTYHTEEVATMTHVTRYCTGCGGERPFEQFHAEAAGCPDVPDGDCPEWGCSMCGEALFIGLPADEQVSSGSAARAA